MKESMSIKDSLNNTTGVQRIFLVCFAVAELYAIYSAFDDARYWSSYMTNGAKNSEYLSNLFGNLFAYTAFILFCFAIIFIAYKVIRWVIAGFKKKSN